jgi:WD40 repeat protein
VVFLKRDINFVFSVFSNVANAHAASINFLRYTSDAEYLLSGAGDGVVKLWSAFNVFASPNITKSINGQSIDWDGIYKKFGIGTYNTLNTPVNFQQIEATNCALTVDPNDLSKCTCPAGQVFWNGTCLTFSCVGIQNSLGTINISNGTTAGTSCNCNPGYVWNLNQFLC